MEEAQFGLRAEETQYTEVQKHFAPFFERHLQMYAGENSSVPTEVAAEVFTSLLFTVSLPLRRLAPAEKQHMLLTEDPELLLKRGSASLERLAGQAKLLLGKARRVPLPLPNLALEDTLRSIETFFARYDLRYFAHDIPADIDYPLALPVPETLLGAEYVARYLHSLLVELNFLEHFDPQLVQRLLLQYCPDPAGQLINLYEPVFTNALGCVLLQADPLLLDIPSKALRKLMALLLPAGEEQVQTMLEDAAHQLAGLCGEGEAPQEYYVQVAGNLSPHVRRAAGDGTLQRAFLSVS